MDQYIYTVCLFLTVAQTLNFLSMVSKNTYHVKDTNSLQTFLKKYFKPENALWFSFVISLFIIFLVTFIALKADPFLKAVYILAGVTVSVIQIFVAYINYTGKKLNFLDSLNRILSKEYQFKTFTKKPRKR